MSKAKQAKKAVDALGEALSKRVGKSVDDLPMDLASQKARAREIGFDPSQTWYHGTGSGEFSEFDPDLSSTPGVSGFFTKNKKFAEDFANKNPSDPSSIDPSFKPHIFETHLKSELPFDYENPRHVDELIQYLAGKTGFSGEENAAKLATGDWSFLEEPEVLSAIKRAGFDSVFVKEGGNKNLAVFKPNQIRSTNAKFDPKKKNSGNILDTMAPLAVGGAAVGASESWADDLANPIQSGALGTVGDALETADKYTGNPARAAAKGLIERKNPFQEALDSVLQNRQVSGNDVARAYLEKTPGMGIPMPNGTIEYPAEDVMGLAADVALDPTNAVPVGAIKKAPKLLKTISKLLP